MEAASPCPALPSPETIQVPSCNSQLQVRGAELGSSCSKCCPESIHPHLAQPGGWAVNPLQIKRVILPKEDVQRLHVERPQKIALKGTADLPTDQIVSSESPKTTEVSIFLAAIQPDAPNTPTLRKTPA